MSRFRSIPLLLAVTACLAVAGCGSDDKPATTSASAPTTAVETAPATPTTTAPAPTTTDTTTATTPTKTSDDTITTGGDDADAPNPLAKLKDYTKGGQPASESDTAAVRTAMREFGDAIASRNAKAICNRTIGLDELMAKSGQKGTTCEKMFKNSGNTAAAPSKKDVQAISAGKVTIKGDRASLEISGGTSLPMRKVDGVWKVDYGAFASLAAGSGQK